MLDAYQAERHPITEQVSVYAMNHSAAMARARREVPADIEAPGPEGDAIRARFGKASYDLNVTQYCCAGLNFGSYYDASPLILPDGEPPPPYSMGSFTPSTVPGCRTPDLWLADGRSLYDAMGPDDTLLRFADAADPGPILTAAAAQGLPPRLLDVRATETAPYRHAMVISRPDQHVAWRGDVAPAAPEHLVARLRGLVSQSKQFGRTLAQASKAHRGRQGRAPPPRPAVRYREGKTDNARKRRRTGDRRDPLHDGANHGRRRI